MCKTRYVDTREQYGNPIQILHFGFFKKTKRSNLTKKMPSVMGTMFSLDDLVSPMIVSGVMNVVFLSGVVGGWRVPLQMLC